MAKDLSFSTRFKGLPLTLVMVTEVIIGRTILGINDEFSYTLSEQFCAVNSTVKHCDFYEVERPAHIIKFPLTIIVLSRYAAAFFCNRIAYKGC